MSKGERHGVAPAREDAPVIGALWILAGTTMMACLALLVHVVGHDVNNAMILFATYIVGSALLLPFALWKRVLFVHQASLGLQVARALASVTQIALFFIALRTVPLVDAVLLRASAPIWVPVLMLVFWRQAMPPRMWLFIAAGFIGVALVLQPFLVPMTLGYALALGSGIVYGLQNVLNRMLDEAGEPLLRTMTWIFVAGACLAAVPAAIDWQTPSPTSLVMLAVIGLSAIASTTALVFGFNYAPAYVLAPFLYFSVVVSALLDWLVFDRVPSVITLVGCVVVVAACVAMTRVAQHQPQKAAAP